MENDSAFRPGGPVIVLNAATTPPTPVQIQGPASGDVTVLLWNSSAGTPAYVSYSPNSAGATANAVVPTAGTPQQVLLCPAGSVQTYTLTGQTGGLFLTAVTGISTATIYAQAGTGL